MPEDHKNVNAENICWKQSPQFHLKYNDQALHFQVICIYKVEYSIFLVVEVTFWNIGIDRKNNDPKEAEREKVGSVKECFQLLMESDYFKILSQGSHVKLIIQ